MTCHECSEQLSDYIEGDLPPEAEAGVAAHLDACADCRQTLADLRAVVDAVRDLPELAPPPGLREQIRAAVRAQGAQARARTTLARVRKIGAGLAAAAALVLMIWAGTAHLERQQLSGLELPAETMVAERMADADAAAREASATAEKTGDMVAVAPEVGEAPAQPMLAAQPAPAAAEEAPSVVVRERPSPAPVQPTHREEIVPEEAFADTVEGATIEVATTRDEVATSATTETVVLSPAPSGRGPGGAAGAAGPPSVALMAAHEPLRVEPKYWAADAGWVAKKGPVGDTPFTVSVFPPSRRAVGEIVPSTVAVEAERDVETARIQVTGSPALEIVDVPADGVIYRGPLVGNQATVQTVYMRANAPGRQSISLNLRSSNPEVETDLEVDLGEFHVVVPPAEQQVDLNLVEVPVRDAIDQIVEQSGMHVVVGEGLPDRSVTKDFSAGVPAAAALTIVVEDVGWTVRAEDAVQNVEPQ